MLNELLCRYSLESLPYMLYVCMHGFCVTGRCSCVCACTWVWVHVCMPDMQACVYCVCVRELGQAMSGAQKNLEALYILSLCFYCIIVVITCT